MDKIKIVLEILKKYHFWALVGLVAVLGLSIYMAAANDLSGQYSKRVAALKTASDQTDGVASKVDHPNEPKIANWKAKKDQQEQKVSEQWRKLYEQQEANNPWPKELGPKFLAKIEKLGPTEEIPSDNCRTYWNEIEKALPGLLETVDYRREVPIEAGNGKDATPAGADVGLGGRLGALGGAGQGNTKPVGTIDWKTYKAILDEFNWSSVPSSTRVRLAQENYWVYRALLTIISKTNGEAKTHADAAIKEIVSLQIGQAASSYILQNRPAIVAEGAGMGMGGVPGSPSGSPESGMSAYGAGGPPGAAGASGQGDDDLLRFRYVSCVDGEMKPLSAEEAKTSPPSYPEFNMMPVVMLLMIDQRKIPDLLVQCANSTMTVEPVQVRINPGKWQASGSGLGGIGGSAAPGLGGAEGMGAMRPAGMGRSNEMGEMGPGGAMRPSMGGMEPGMGGYGSSGFGSGGGLGQLGGESDESSPYEVPVEVRAVVYVYKPPAEPTSSLPADGLSN